MVVELDLMFNVIIERWGTSAGKSFGKIIERMTRVRHECSEIRNANPLPFPLDIFNISNIQLVIREI